MMTVSVTVLINHQRNFTKENGNENNVCYDKW